MQNTNTCGEKHDGNIHVQPVDNRARHVGMLHHLCRMVFDKSKEVRSIDNDRSKTAVGNSPTERKVRQQEMETDQRSRSDRWF